MKVDVRTVELYMHVLPYGEHRPDGITHRPDGSNRLPIIVSSGRNLNACQTLNGVRTDALELWDLLELRRASGRFAITSGRMQS
jgi:hypothetical protein